MTVSPTATPQDVNDAIADIDEVRAPPQHGLSFNTMALNTSDCG